MPVNNNGSHSTSEETSVTLAAAAQLSEPSLEKQPEPESENSSLSISDMPREILQKIMGHVKQAMPAQLREVSRNFKEQFEQMLKDKYHLAQHPLKPLAKQQREINYLLDLEAWLADQTDEKPEEFSEQANNGDEKLEDFAEQVNDADGKSLFTKVIFPGCLEKLKLHYEGDKRDSTFHYWARESYLTTLRKVYRQYQELLFFKKAISKPGFQKFKTTLAGDPQWLENSIEWGLKTLSEKSQWDNYTNYIEREQILNDINASIIEIYIEKSRNWHSFSAHGYLTRIPGSVFTHPDNQDFWREVVDITIEHCFIKDLPSEMAICTKLKHLSLNENGFRKIPAVICQLKTLELLDFYRNKIYDLPPELEQLVNLRRLELSFNRFEQVPAVLTKLKNLEALLLDNNYLKNISPELSDEIFLEKGVDGQEVESSKASTLRLQKDFHLGWKIQKLMKLILVDRFQFHKFFEEIIRSEPSKWSTLINPLERLSEFPDREIIDEIDDDDLEADGRVELELPPKYSTPLHVVMSQLVAGGFLPLCVLQAIVTKENLNWNLSTTDEAPNREKQQTPVDLFMEAVSIENRVALAVFDTVSAKPEIDWKQWLPQIQLRKMFNNFRKTVEQLTHAERAWIQSNYSSSFILADNATSQPLAFSSPSTSRPAKRSRDEGSPKDVLVLTAAEAVGEEKTLVRKRARHT